MKKLTKICCCNFDTNKEVLQPQPRLEQHLEPQSREDLDSHLKPHPIAQNTKAIYARMRENVLYVKEIRFLPDGELHSVIIRFNNSRTEMTLKIDGAAIDKVENIEENQGNVELNIEGLVVDFVWDFVHFPMRFSFYTRKFPSNTEAASSSNYSGDDNTGELNSQAKHWNDHAHVYIVHILVD